LHAYNNSESNELPMAATYVIDEKGIIQYAFLHEDYRNRAEPSEVLKAVKKLNK
jgi:peroxiredoxin